MKNLNKIVGNNIKKIRKENNLTMEMVAKKIGLTNRSSIAHLENGSRSITLDTLEKVANALNIPVVKLLEQ